MKRLLRLGFNTPRVTKMFFRISRLIHGLECVAAPILDLIVRLSLAQIFMVSAIVKLSDWNAALFLAEHEYPVRWLSPHSAAILGVSVELIAGIMLAIGLGTRAAAIALGALSIVIQVEYRTLDAHLFWIALFVWYAFQGASALSVDHWIAPGLKRSPVPFSTRVIDALERITRTSAPWLLLTLRVWLAAACLTAAFSVITFDVYVPRQSASAYLTLSGVLLIALTSVGFATRAMSTIHIVETLALIAMTRMDMVHGYWVMVLTLFATHGPGALALDTALARYLKKRFPQLEGKPAFSLEGLPHVVIVGAGFGGLSCAQRLAETPVRITLIDRHNYHLFQPLLYQVATSALSPGDIAMPIRSVLKDQFNARVLLGEVTGVNTKDRQVLVGSHRIDYDYLVLATGAAHSYFGKDQWAPFAPGLKRIEDAIEVRRRILTAFERAEATADAAERDAQLTFLIVGGGPTGVELAGAIAELARYGMQNEFRDIDPARAQVVLVQAGPRLLPTFPEALSASTLSALENLGVKVLLNSRVQAIDENGVLIDGKHLPSKTVLWAAGVIASPAGQWLGAERDTAGRIKVNLDLSVPGHDNIFAVGDTALANSWNGTAVPGLAPAAKQGGEHVAQVLHARVMGRETPCAFRYRHLGSLATIGRKAAVADVATFQLSGATAWWLWGLVHIAFLVGVRNRFSVLIDWFWSYLTFKTATRLITGSTLKRESTMASESERQPSAPVISMEPSPATYSSAPVNA